MHYKDGAEAKIGDTCRFLAMRFDEDAKAWIHVQREGVVVRTFPAAETCNALVAFARLDSREGVGLVTVATEYVTLNKCEKTELRVEP